MHTISISEIQTKLGTDPKTGLTNEDAKNRIATYGLNEIEQSQDTSILTIVLRQFKSPIVFLLLFAIGLSFAYSKWGDAIAILVVLLVNTCIGFFMEFKAERSMNALRRLTKTAAKVIRNGILFETTTTELVPGDLLYLEAGDIIPADARIVDAFQLQVNESALTGESIPSEKQECILDENTPLADRQNILFKGTFVTRGNAHAIVVATGMLTELGKIASLVQAGEQTTTPIEKRLAEFSKKLIWITVLIAVVIFFIGILNGKAILDMLTTVIALSVAAIPEGLPIVATLALAHGMMKMARQNVIVKKLASVETLGGTNVICTDKTGTLTYNKIRVSHIITADFHSFDKSKPTESGRQVLHASVLCNNANFAGHDEEMIEVGDPLEVGLLQFAASHIDLQDFRTRFPKVSEEPFKSETKIMATLHAGPDGKIVFAKGAAEAIIQICTHYLDGDIEKTFPPQLKAYWLKIAEHEASQGLKVLAFAADKNADDSSSINLKGLTFLGIAALIDAHREEVPEAIQHCHKAGIKVVMITGDHPSTAKNIACQIGIGSDENEGVIEGASMPAFEKLSKTQKDQWKSTTIFARVSPSQKLDLIQVLQEDHNIVAMTGDGVNDAPALKKADIGIAMGMRGTDVAKEVADMVLKDDSFASIVSAIREGRIIFENIRKFLMFLLSSNLSEILVIATLFLINSPVALVPLQILFINLLSDVFPALALGFSAGSNHIMDRPPRDPVKPILNNAQWMSVIVYATIIAGWTFLATLLTQGSRMTEHDVMLSSTVLFYTLVLCQLLHVFNVGDHAQAFFKTDVFRNGYVWAGVLFSALLAVSAYFIAPVNRVLNVGGLQTENIIVIIGCSFGSLITIQTLKRMHAIH